MKSNDHPLFPPLEDDEDAVAPEVEFIHVTRFEPGASSPVWCSYKFAAEELTDAQQITEMFGGGNYELIARAGSRISARRRYSLAGKSRPLVIGGPVEPEPVSVPHAPASPGGVSSMGGDGWLQLMAMMQQQNQSILTAVMASSQQSMQAIVGMATAMVSRDADGSKTLIQAIQANANQALSSQAQLFSTIVQASGSGGGKDAVSAFKEGIELANSLRPESDGDSMGDTIGQVVDGLKMATQLSGGSLPEDLEATG